MTEPEDIARDFQQLPAVRSVNYGGKFIKVTMSGGTGLSPLNTVENAYEDEIELAGGHPAYDLSGRTPTVVYKFLE